MTRRGIAAIVGALLAGAALLGIQLAAGGADYVPQAAADPCQERTFRSADDLEGLGELVVLAGLDAAACDLGVSRERFVLAVPVPRDRAALARQLGTDEAGIAKAIEDGLRTGVDRLERADALPPTDDVLDWVADEVGISQTVVDLIPDAIVDRLPSTASLLRTAVSTLDVPTVLDGLDSGEPLGPVLRDALVRGARDAAEKELRDILPGPLEGLIP